MPQFDLSGLQYQSAQKILVSAHYLVAFELLIVQQYLKRLLVKLRKLGNKTTIALRA